jgi:hypothetical protein
MSPVRSWSERRKEAAEAPSGFKPLEPGNYNFIIKEPAKVGQTNAGKTRWTINPHVEDGPRANARIFHDFYDSDKPSGLSYLFEQLEALGLSDFLNTEPSDEALAQAMLGRRFSAEVYNDTYEGKVRQKLRRFRAPAGPPVAGPGGPGGVAAPAFGGPGSLGAGPGGPAASVAAPPPAHPQGLPSTPSQSPAPGPAPAQNPNPEPQQYNQQQVQAQQAQPQPQAQAHPAAGYQPVDQQAVQGGVNPWTTEGQTPPPLPQF